YLHERYHGRLYAKAQNLRGGLRAKYDAMLQKFDALVMPSTPMKAHRREERSPYAMLTNTAPFDVTGHPGLSVPCGMSDGLPIGLMLIGRHFEDALKVIDRLTIGCNEVLFTELVAWLHEMG